jgi:hypothetical protein
MFGRGGKISLMSESVTDIQINIHLARENLTTRHTHNLCDLTATICNDNQEVGPSPTST